MDTLLKELVELPVTFHQPATPAELATAQRHLSCLLPPQVSSFYLRHDGMPPQQGVHLRFMALAEVTDFHQIAVENGWAQRGVRFLWTDDNSDYAGLYVEGALEGKVCFLNHDDPDLSPCYRSLPSFFRALIVATEGSLDWYEMARDYPEVRSGHSPIHEEDWSLVRELELILSSAQEDDERRYWTFCIMNMTPPRYTEHLVKYLDSDDMWIPARCCEILGMRKYISALPQLVQIARANRVNSGIAAILALGQIGNNECLAHLLRLSADLPRGNSPYIAKALEGCGCQVTHDRGNWFYRFSAAEAWKPLP